MSAKTIYQTLQDRGNPYDIEQNGPFKCSRRKAWAGPGYYFWDTFLENAHWWGKNSCSASYVICQSAFEFNENTCYDLVGNTDHLEDFNASIQLLVKKGLITKITTFARVMEFLKSIGFNFPVIRLYGVNTKAVKNNRSIFYFTESGTQYLDYRPAIQICIYRLNDIGFEGFKIIYPAYYIQDYVV